MEFDWDGEVSFALGMGRAPKAVRMTRQRNEARERSGPRNKPDGTSVGLWEAGAGMPKKILKKIISLHIEITIL